MKKIWTLMLFVTLLAASQLAQAQTDEPRFPGCDDAADVDCADMKMMQFVFSNLKHPDGSPSGEVLASFTVKADGSIADIKIEEGLTEPCNQEVIRILKLMPNWLPAEEAGAAVDMEWDILVKFKG